MKNKETILILDANQRSALAAARSLGQQDLDVICADETEKTLTGASRYVCKSISYPSPYKEQEKFIEELSNNIKSAAIRYLLPMTDITAEIVLANKAKLGDVIVLLPEYQSYMMVSDKYQLLEMALKENIPIPETLFFSGLDELIKNIDNIKYPVVIKPDRSIIKVNGKYNKTAVKYANSKVELLGVIKEYTNFYETKFLVQEYIDGHGEGLFVLCKEGKVTQYFSHKRLREKPPSGGVSVLSESIATKDELMEIANKILGPLNWNGVAMVEFKIKRNKQPVLMEVNGRFWGSLQLAVDSGVDFPFLLYQQFSKTKELMPRCEYREGIQLRWFLGDVDNLIIILRDHNITFSEKLLSVLRFLRLYRRDQYYEVNRIQDIKPAIHEILNYL